MKKLWLFVLLVLLIACEPIPEVKISGGNNPVFTVDGRARLVEFHICCERDLEPRNEQNYLWKIAPNGEIKWPLDIVYGVVPDGFRQNFPENRPPSLLNAGKQYQYWAQGYYGGKVGCFEIRDGKPEIVGCAPFRELSVKLDDEAELPKFSINGSDFLFDVEISFNDNSDKNSNNWRTEILWKIRPNDENKKKLPIEIVYGTLPEGYTQLVPDGGKQPLRLKPGIKYRYRIQGIYDGKTRCFRIVDSKVHEADCDYRA